MAIPTSESQFGGLMTARGHADGVDLADMLGAILAEISTVNSGFQGTPEQYEVWIAQQLQDAHDQVWLSSDLKTDGDSMGDLKPGLYLETNPDVYTKVPQDQARIIVEGNGPSRTVAVRTMLYSVTLDGSEYVLTQRQL